MTDLRCSVIDHTVPANPPLSCGFPATTMLVHDGETVGICEHHETQAIVSGYVLTRLAEESR